MASTAGGRSLRAARVGCLSGPLCFCEFDSDPGSFFPISFAVPPLTTRNQLAITRVGPCQYGRASHIRRIRLMPHRTATIGVCGKSLSTLEEHDGTQLVPHNIASHSHPRCSQCASA